MKVRLLVVLRHFFNIAGWLSLVGIVLSAWMELKIQLDSNAISHFFSISTPFANRMANLAQGVSNVFFAFFMGAVLLMVQHKRLINGDLAERFLLITCGSFVVQAVLLAYIETRYAAVGMNWMDLFGTLHFVIAKLANVAQPLVYAATTYLMYSHFKQMVTFESEVV